MFRRHRRLGEPISHLFRAIIRVVFSLVFVMAQFRFIEDGVDPCELAMLGIRNDRGEFEPIVRSGPNGSEVLDCP